MLIPMLSLLSLGSLGPMSLTLGTEVSLYRPSIDAELGGTATPFADVFGEGPFPLTRVELSLHLTQPFGSVGLILRGGWLTTSARARVDRSPDNLVPSPTEQRSGGRTRFTMLPISALASLRFDLLWRELGVPLVPYAGAGFAYGWWWVYRGDSSIAVSAGERALGGSMGLELDLGLALRLEAIDKTARKALEQEFGITGVELRASMLWLTLDGFGAEDALDIGDLTIGFTLAIEL